MARLMVSVVAAVVLLARAAAAQTEIPAAVVQQLVSERDDRPFHLAQGAFITAAMADLAVTQYQIGRGIARESMLGAGLERHPIAFGVLKGGLVATQALLWQRAHRQRPRLAFWLAVVSTGVEVAATAHNARIGGAR